MDTTDRDNRVALLLTQRRHENRRERERLVREIGMLREELSMLKEESSDILRHAKKGEWWKFKGILSDEDIESLCNVDPREYLYQDID